MQLKFWPSAEKPREKLIHHGAQQLSDAELLAIMLGCGTSSLNAIELAHKLLTEFQGLRALLHAEPKTFCQKYGLGLARYARLQAALELTRRCWAEKLQLTSVLDNPQCTRQYLSACLSGCTRETFGVLLLNNQHHVLEFEVLFQGTIHTAAVYPREIARSALKHNAAALIIAHNHPSGCVQPSYSDQQVTQQIIHALKILDVRVIDHIIVGSGQCFSFAEQGWL